MRLCVSHITQPIMPRQRFDELILTTECPDYDVLQGSAVCPALIRRCRWVPSVTLMTHRRIATRRLSSATATPAAIAARPAENFTPRPGHDFLVFMMMCPNGVAAQFAQAHLGGEYDWQEYTDIAASMGTPFIDGTIFIPGGVQLGVFPGSVIVDILTKVHAVNLAYAARHRERIRGTRNVSFLAERLESCLLGQELTRRYPTRFPTEILGVPILVGEA